MQVHILTLTFHVYTCDISTDTYIYAPVSQHLFTASYTLIPMVAPPSEYTCPPHFTVGNAPGMAEEAITPVRKSPPSGACHWVSFHVSSLPAMVIQVNDSDEAPDPMRDGGRTVLRVVLCGGWARWGVH